MTISTFNVRVSEIIRLFSTKRKREKERKRKRWSSAFSFLFSLDRASHSLRSSDRTTNTTRRDFCVPDGRLLCGKERCEIRLAAFARMELKRVSCGCFGGRSFAMSPLTSLAPTTVLLVDRDLKLHFNSEMKQLCNREFLPCIVRKYCFTDWNAMRCS